MILAKGKIAGNGCINRAIIDHYKLYKGGINITL